MSPLSDTTNLAPAVAGSTLFDHVKHMIWTTGQSLVVALIAYLLIGMLGQQNSNADLSAINEILNFITDNYKISIVCLIPPVFVILAVAFKLPVLPALLGGVLLGLPFFEMQGNSIIGNGAEGIPGAAYFLNYGVSVEVREGSSAIIQEVGSLLSTSGMQGMMSVAYTHLDVYKRQPLYFSFRFSRDLCFW